MVANHVVYPQVETRFATDYAHPQVVLVNEVAFVASDIRNVEKVNDEQEEVQEGYQAVQVEVDEEKIFLDQIKKKVATTTKNLG